MEGTEVTIPEAQSEGEAPQECYAVFTGSDGSIYPTSDTARAASRKKDIIRKFADRRNGMLYAQFGIYKDSEGVDRRQTSELSAAKIYTTYGFKGESLSATVMIVVEANQRDSTIGMRGRYAIARSPYGGIVAGVSNDLPDIEKNSDADKFGTVFKTLLVVLDMMYGAAGQEKKGGFVAPHASVLLSIGMRGVIRRFYRTKNAYPFEELVKARINSRGSTVAARFTEDQHVVGWFMNTDMMSAEAAKEQAGNTESKAEIKI